MNDSREQRSPDAERVYALYLETCRRLGVKPASRDTRSRRADQRREQNGEAERKASEA